MKKFFTLLFALGMLSASAAKAEVGSDSIVINTTASVGGYLRMSIGVYDGVDEDGDTETTDPKFGTNLTIDGVDTNGPLASYGYFTVTSQRIVLHGNVVSLSVTSGVAGVDLSGASYLEDLRLAGSLTAIDPSKATKLTSLTLNDCANLKSIDLKGLDNLTTLGLNGTAVDNSLDLSNLTKLQTLYLGENKRITSIDLSHMPDLYELWVNGDSLTSLDLSHNPSIEYVYAERNALTALDVTNNTELSWLSVWGNNINGENMDKLVASLAQSDMSPEFAVYNSIYEGEKNVLTKTQAAAVKARGWKPEQAQGTSLDNFSWVEYEGTDVSTGINKVDADAAAVAAPAYNLAGQRVGKDYKGVVVVNGRKYLRK